MNGFRRDRFPVAHCGAGAPDEGDAEACNVNRCDPFAPISRIEWQTDAAVREVARLRASGEDPDADLDEDGAPDQPRVHIGGACFQPEWLANWLGGDLRANVPSLPFRASAALVSELIAHGALDADEFDPDEVQARADDPAPFQPEIDAEEGFVGGIFNPDALALRLNLDPDAQMARDRAAAPGRLRNVLTPGEGPLVPFLRDPDDEIESALASPLGDEALMQLPRQVASDEDRSTRDRVADLLRDQGRGALANQLVDPAPVVPLRVNLATFFDADALSEDLRVLTYELVSGDATFDERSMTALIAAMTAHVHQRPVDEFRRAALQRLPELARQLDPFPEDPAQDPHPSSQQALDSLEQRLDRMDRDLGDRRRGLEVWRQFREQFRPVLEANGAWDRVLDALVVVAAVRGAASTLETFRALFPGLMVEARLERIWDAHPWAPAAFSRHTADVLVGLDDLDEFDWGVFARVRRGEPEPDDLSHVWHQMRWMHENPELARELLRRIEPEEREAFAQSVRQAREDARAVGPVRVNASELARVMQLVRMKAVQPSSLDLVDRVEFVPQLDEPARTLALVHAVLALDVLEGLV